MILSHLTAVVADRPSTAAKLTCSERQGRICQMDVQGKDATRVCAAGVHKFTKNLGVASKFWSSEG